MKVSSTVWWGLFGKGATCYLARQLPNIKEVLGFRQFSLRGLEAVRGEWGLVCLAYDLKRWHTLATA